MIGVSIALVVWCAGLSFVTARTEKRRVSEGVLADEEASGDEVIDVDKPKM